MRTQRLFTYLATLEHERALERLAQRIGNKVGERIDAPLRLVEILLALAAQEHNVKMPRRVDPPGGKRVGAGRKPQPKDNPGPNQDYSGNHG